MKKIFLLLMFFNLAFVNLKAQTWASVPGGSLNGQPSTMISFSGYRWFSGSFSTAGPISSIAVVRHDGINWVSTPFLEGQATAFCVWNNTLYASGSFIVGSITYGAVKWNGFGWDYFGVIPNGQYFNTLTVFNNQLVFGGRSLSVDAVSINHLAKWDGVTWSSFPFTINCSWATLPNIREVKEINSYLFIGGDFSEVNSIQTPLSFKTDGSSVIPLSLTPNNYVSSFAKYHDSTFCTGSFNFGPFPANQGSPGIVKTNDATWHQVDHGLKLKGLSLSSSLTGLYVGGQYINWCFNTPCNHADVGNLGKWDGVAWSNESTGLFNQGNEVINFLYTDTINNVIYALGDFHTNRGDVADFVAKRQFSIVPVHLSSFTASLGNNKTVALQWRDETPSDRNSFEVQMSTDGRNFSTVGTIAGKSSTKDYTFSYRITGCGTRYFRLKFDGATYSASTTVSSPCDIDIQGSTQSLSIHTAYPGTLTLSTPSSQTVARTVLAQGYHQIPVVAPPGLYIAKFIDKQGTVFVSKVFIQ